LKDNAKPTKEKKLQDSEARYRSLFEESRDMMHMFDVDCRIIDINQAELDALGYSREELIGTPVSDLVSPEFRDEAKQRCTRLLLGESIKAMHMSLLTRHGDRIEVEATASPQIEHGRVIAGRAILRDITERLAAEQEREVLASFPQYNPAPLMRVDAHCRVLYANDAAVALFGSHFTGSDVRLVPGLQNVDAEACIRTGRRMVSFGEIGGQSFQWVLQGVVELGLLHIYGSDISERRRIEQRYRHLVEMMPDAVAVHQDGRIVYSNSICAAMFGYESPEAMQGAGILQHVHPDYREIVLQRVRDVASGVESLPSTEEKMLRLDGCEFWAEVSAGKVEHDGRPASQVVVRDISERKQAEERLQLTQFTLDHAPDAIYWMEPDGRFVYVNDAACEMLGYTREELLLMGVKDIDPSLPEGIPAEMAQATRDQGPRRVETSHRTKAGRDIPVEIVVSCIVHAGTEYHCSFVRDISERKLREQFEADYRHILEQIADSSVPLSGVLASIVEAVQRQRPDMPASILLLNDEGTQLRRGALAGLPEAYGRMLDGVPIGPSHGSCGTAAYRGERVIVSDIAHDPLWAGARDVALPYGLAACWSEPIKNTQGQVLGTFALYYNEPRLPDDGDLSLIESLAAITANAINHKQAEEKIMQAAERLHMVLDADFDAVIVHQDLQVVFTNRAAQQMFGFHSQEETIGVNPQDFMDPRFRSLAAAIARKVIRTGQPTGRIELGAIHHIDGHIFPMEIGSARIYWEGRPAVVSIVRDISERKAAEQAIRDSEKRYRQLVEMMPDGIVLHESGRVVFANPEALRMYGYSEEEAIGQPILDRIHPDSRAVAVQRTQKLIEQKSGFNPLIEQKMIRLDGTEFVAEAASAYVEYKGRPTVLAVLRDVTSRVESEQALRDSEYRYRHLVDLMPDGIVLAEQGRVVFANPEALRLYGYSPEEAIGQPILERIHPDERAAVAERVQKLIVEKGGMNPLLEERMLRKDGSTFIAEAASAFVEYQGRPAVLVVLRDITERKEAEQRLRDSEQRLHHIVSASPVPTVVTRLSDGKVLFSNVEARMMFGVSDEEHASQLFAPEIYVRAEDRSWMVGEVKEKGYFKGEIELHRLDGTRFWTLFSSRKILFGGEQAIIAQLIDTTAHRLLEEQFRQAQKMESVGTLVGGIAHDFNNMLAGMLGQLYLVRHELLDSGREHESRTMIERINAIEKQGRMAADVIAQLMTFARKGQVVMERLDVNQLVTDAMRLHRVSIPENIVIRAHLGDALEVQGDAGLIQQMLLNLLTNARDALQGVTDPQVDISLSSFKPDRDFLRQHGEFADIAYACLEVRDNGCGMDVQQIGRIFDPFFTTKPVGKGTGLGLAMLYGAMQTHCGAVLVDSKPGEGSCFRLFFPQLEHVGIKGAQAEELLMHGAGQTILLVDDESMLIEVIGQSLQLIGYRVLTAHDGEQAVRLFSEHQQEVDLAILDVVMPVKGGVAAAIEIRAIRPDLPVIFYTGYDEEADLGDVQGWNACTTVRKPANVEQLSRIIADLLRAE